MSEAAAVLLNWNLADLTPRCVRALTDDGLAGAQVVVVDNGSESGEVDRLSRELPADVHVVALPRNID
jgi:GT2 family glycosyltransferase